jgi:hypothetical protein
MSITSEHTDCAVRVSCFRMVRVQLLRALRSLRCAKKVLAVASRRMGGKPHDGDGPHPPRPIFTTLSKGYLTVAFLWIMFRFSEDGSVIFVRTRTVCTPYSYMRRRPYACVRMLAFGRTSFIATLQRCSRHAGRRAPVGAPRTPRAHQFPSR